MSLFKKRAGGFLNNVDGKVTDYNLTIEPEAFEAQEWDDGSHTIYAELSVLVDGGEEPVTTTLKVGNDNFFDISEDGKSLEPKVNDDDQPLEDAEWSRLITSMIAAGLPESDFPEGGNNYEAILEKRFRFFREKDAEATASKGKRKGKNGKEYDRDVLKVSAYYGDEPAGKGKGKTTGKTTAPTSKVAQGGKANGKAKEQDLDEVVDETLLAILKDNKGSIAKSKLPIAISKKLGVKHPQREEIRKRMYSDEYLEEATERGVIEYDTSDKKQMIAAA